MTYVIAQPCIDVKDRAGVDECPVDCIYEGERSLCIQAPLVAAYPPPAATA